MNYTTYLIGLLCIICVYERGKWLLISYKKYKTDGTKTALIGQIFMFFIVLAVALLVLYSTFQI